MSGVVSIFVLQDQASVDILLYLSFYLIGLLFRSRVGFSFLSRDPQTRASA